MCNGYVQSAFLLIIKKSSYLEDFFSALPWRTSFFVIGSIRSKSTKNLIQNHQKTGLKTIRRFVPLDTPYRASRNGVSSTVVLWRVKELAFLPLRPRRLPAPTGKTPRFLRLEPGSRNVIYQFTNLPLGGLRCSSKCAQSTEHSFLRSSKKW